MFYGLELCQRGYITLMPDLECFEERQASVEDRERWLRQEGQVLVNGQYEMFVAMRYLQQGSCLQAHYVQDLARAIDYLCTRPEVDSERIGVLGHSLGGQEVCWLLLYDQRLKVGVCSCGVSTFETIFQAGINHNFAAYVPGLLTVGDMDHFVAALAPTPLLMTTGMQDPIFPVDGVRRIAEVAGAAYVEAGVPEAYRLREFPGGHGFPAEVRAEAYAWLDHWLKA